MNLSKQTVEILKNFSTINQGIAFKEGNVIRTMSVMRNIFAKAVIGDMLPRDFCIYDLPEFLSTSSLFDSPAFQFEDKYIQMSSGNNRIKYYYSSPAVVIAPPDKELIMKGTDMQFKLTEEMLAQIQKASSVMKLKDIVISNKGVSILNTSAPGNQYDIDTQVITDLENVTVTMKVDDLKIIPADYDVNVASAGMVQFVSTTPGLTIEYFVAIQS